MTRRLFAPVLFVIANPVLAHSDTPPASLWQAYTLDAAVVIPLLLFAGLYGVGVGRIWQRAGSGRGIDYWRPACFAAAMLALILALIWPFDVLGEYALSAHMSQHVLLTTVAAPFIVLSAPLATMIWALPFQWRRRLGRIGQNRLLKQGRELLTLPVFAWLLYALCLWGWHMPALYEMALQNETLHILEHASFLLSALLLWWTALVSVDSAELGLGSGIFLLFATSLHSGFLGALLTFGQDQFYPVYSQTPSWLSLPPLADQQIAGLIMWLPGSFIYLASAMVMAYLWFARLNRHHYVSGGSPDRIPSNSFCRK